MTTARKSTTETTVEREVIWDNSESPYFNCRSTSLLSGTSISSIENRIKAKKIPTVLIKSVKGYKVKCLNLEQLAEMVEFYAFESTKAGNNKIAVNTAFSLYDKEGELRFPTNSDDISDTMIQSPTHITNLNDITN